MKRCNRCQKFFTSCICPRMPKPNSQIPMVADEDIENGQRVTRLVKQAWSPIYIVGTVTGRMSSKEPNLSNRSQEDGPMGIFEGYGEENLHDAGGEA